MSVVFVVVPVVAGGWPIVAAAVLGAGAALGYRALTQVEQQAGVLPHVGVQSQAAVDLVMDDSQVLTDALQRGESFTLEREGVTATFARDGRGAVHVHVTGEGHAQASLEAAGHELMDRVRQQFAYAKVMEELEARGFDVVQEEVEATGTIRVRVRRWS